MQHVLLVEEEFLIALDINNILMEAGVADVASVRSVAEAHALSAPLGYFDLAIVEAQMGAPDVVAFCAELQRQGIPVVVVSADSRVAGSFPGVVLLEKPFSSEALLSACGSARLATPEASGAI